MDVTERRCVGQVPMDLAERTVGDHADHRRTRDDRAAGEELATHHDAPGVEFLNVEDSDLMLQAAAVQLVDPRAKTVVAAVCAAGSAGSGRMELDLRVRDRDESFGITTVECFGEPTSKRLGGGLHHRSVSPQRHTTINALAPLVKRPAPWGERSRLSQPSSAKRRAASGDRCDCRSECVGAQLERVRDHGFVLRAPVDRRSGCRVGRTVVGACGSQHLGRHAGDQRSGRDVARDDRAGRDHEVLSDRPPCKTMAPAPSHTLRWMTIGAATICLRR